MRIDTLSSISASLTCFKTVNVDRFENRFTYKGLMCCIWIQHLLSYYGVSKTYFSYLLHIPLVTPGGEGLYRSCSAGCVVEDTSFEVERILPEEPVRVSRGVGRTISYGSRLVDLEEEEVLVELSATELRDGTPL